MIALGNSRDLNFMMNQKNRKDCGKVFLCQQITTILLPLINPINSKTSITLSKSKEESSYKSEEICHSINEKIKSI
jgi:hypothetical protein